TGQVHFVSSDGTATLPSNYTFTGGDAGVHLFTNGVILKVAGSQTVTVNDTSSGINNTSSAINVTASGASTLTMSTLTPGLAAGTSQNVTVTAKDSFGNIATAYTGTVQFTSTDPFPAALASNYAFVAGDNGVHTF